MSTFICGTRKVIAIPGGGWRVVCATCEAGTVQHLTRESATRACVRDSAKPCKACGAS